MWFTRYLTTGWEFAFWPVDGRETFKVLVDVIRFTYCTNKQVSSIPRSSTRVILYRGRKTLWKPPFSFLYSQLSREWLYSVWKTLWRNHTSRSVATMSNEFFSALRKRLWYSIYDGFQKNSFLWKTNKTTIKRWRQWQCWKLSIGCKK